ncbi:C-type lectin domain family 17, member A isoform X4 [Ailuropoda melanoleuca]|uniref:C-type lectin domain family 17, member A isoform X4 n=1 Tax=Ailuropoda melanoleuca TaxID=9646 RepID=UPI001494C60F|nr:C-type lectin domain family 17, member A isoform X4 [Ailuropoda melanoleuca]
MASTLASATLGRGTLDQPFGESASSWKQIFQPQHSPRQPLDCIGENHPDKLPLNSEPQKPRERTRDEEDGDDYENMAPPYKDLPPKPDSMAPPRPPRAGKKMENPPLPCKSPKIKGLDRNPVSRTSPQLGVNLEPPPFQPSPANQEMVEELRILTFQQMEWQANVTGMAGIAGLKKDIDHIRTNTNQSLLELRGLLDCTRVTCPEGWLPFEGKCYYFSSTTKSWDEARKSCQENYSHLVIISSFAEQNFVSRAHGSPRVYWLGLNDREREGDWKWLDGSPVTLSFWDPEEPNNIFDEDCASMNKGGTWNDLSCDKSTYWICERKCSC